ncbi:MAG: toll/interleukin-1 receptor domain-containing protein [Hyphomicrobiaceae bacterium]
MADLFISYSSKDRALAEALARDIKAAGWSVWWDPEIRAGEDYRDVILRELDVAKAVVVIWTKNSVKSEWVISEASRAMRKPRDRYVAVREDGLDEHDIPPPFDVRHAIVLTNRLRLIGSIAPLFPQPNNAALAPQFVPYKDLLRKKKRGLKRVQKTLGESQIIRRTFTI